MAARVVQAGNLDFSAPRIPLIFDTLMEPREVEISSSISMRSVFQSDCAAKEGLVGLGLFTDQSDAHGDYINTVEDDELPNPFDIPAKREEVECASPRLGSVAFNSDDDVFFSKVIGKWDKVSSTATSNNYTGVSKVSVSSP